jgi:hypothetical protein
LSPRADLLCDKGCCPGVFKYEPGPQEAPRGPNKYTCDGPRKYRSLDMLGTLNMGGGVLHCLRVGERAGCRTNLSQARPLRQGMTP